MSVLEIRDLHVTVETDAGVTPILNGVTLTIRTGETHAIMGPNGSGKSTLAYTIAGHPKYTVTSGTITLDGEDVLEMSVDDRARAGLFLAMQYPVEVPGVRLADLVGSAVGQRGAVPVELAVNPANDDARYDYVKLLISAGHLEEAGAALQPALVQIPVQLRFEALAQWRAALEAVAADPRRDWSVEQFDAKIAENKRDFDLRLAKSRVLLARGELTAAMDELLEIVMRDKKWSDELPRKTYIAILELLTPPKPKAAADAAGKTAGGIELMGKAAMVEDPQAALVSSYRRKLSMALN